MSEESTKTPKRRPIRARVKPKKLLSPSPIIKQKRVSQKTVSKEERAFLKKHIKEGVNAKDNRSVLTSYGCNPKVTRVQNVLKVDFNKPQDHITDNILAPAESFQIQEPVEGTEVQTLKEQLVELRRRNAEQERKIEEQQRQIVELSTGTVSSVAERLEQYDDRLKEIEEVWSREFKETINERLDQIAASTQRPTSVENSDKINIEGISVLRALFTTATHDQTFDDRLVHVAEAYFGKSIKNIRKNRKSSGPDDVLMTDIDSANIFILMRHLEGVDRAPKVLKDDFNREEVQSSILDLSKRKRYTSRTSAEKQMRKQQKASKSKNNPLSAIPPLATAGSTSAVSTPVTVEKEPTEAATTAEEVICSS